MIEGDRKLLRIWPCLREKETYVKRRRQFERYRGPPP